MSAKIPVLLAVASLILWPINALAETIPAPNNSESRLTQALSNNPLNLDDNAKNNLITKCKSAQIILRDIRLQSTKAVKLRIDTYSGIQADLQSIKLRMLRQGSDASETDLLSGKLQQLIEKFTFQTEDFDTSLNDISTIDCSQKPELFMAGLILARAQRAKVYNTAQEVNRLINDSQNDIFYQLKKRLTL